MGEINSVSGGSGKTWGLRWSASASSISVSRVTMIGLLKGREVRLPKVKSFVSGYKGSGETSTVRSVMVVVQNKVKNFRGQCVIAVSIFGCASLKIDEKHVVVIPFIMIKISKFIYFHSLDIFLNNRCN